MSQRESLALNTLPDAGVRVVPVIGNTVSTATLLAERSVLTLIHNNQAYQLRITSNNKLILTK